ncbi:glycerol kinase GlpK [Methylacidimicrobium sp. AP8]|uniref:FGGY family carbohydrate kinase n=1 Tax=Methylacidimicrobium sp. AP8 TaxID=2730359 RepID=UPI001921DC47|nr:glycerol kinase GlpK [Methylacidimicrobium sp. AP8]
MDYILALDQGTTSSRALLLDRKGRIAGQAMRPVSLLTPKPEWVEQSPELLWRSLEEAACEALERAGAVPRRIAGIGIANQRETFLLWDRQSLEPVGNAIVWQDRRSTALCDRLRKAGWEEPIGMKTGLRLNPYFSGTKLLWLWENLPVLSGRRDRLRFGTVDSWLLAKLTGGKVHATEESNASRTLLYNIHEHRWDADLLALFQTPPSLLPEVLPSAGPFGKGAGFWEGIPILAVLGDQQASLYGQLCWGPGSFKTTYGTGAFSLMNLGSRPPTAAEGLLVSSGWRLEGETTYVLEGCVFAAGAAVGWLVDGLRLAPGVEQAEALARQASETEGLVFVPALTGLGSPYWDPSAEGLLIGITRRTRPSHIARAVWEGIAHQVCDVIEAMARAGGAPLHQMKVDGGAARSDLLLQIQADLLGFSVVRSGCREATALGVGLLAGREAGFFATPEERSGFGRIERIFSPLLDARERRRKREAWKDAVGRTRGWRR